MFEQYSHTLIAKPKHFSPSPEQVERFLSTIVTRNVVPESPTIVLRMPTGKFREFPYINPFTGQNLKVEIKEHRKFTRLEEITSVLGSLQNYEIEVAAMGRPKLPPLDIDIEEAYHVGVTCYVYSTLRSTSDPHETSTGGEMIAPYRQQCSELLQMGYFVNPHNMRTIKVPEAGCARFWVEFELGKFLLPRFTNDGLEFLNPSIVSDAKNIFGIDFVQGCYWG